MSDDRTDLPTLGILRVLTQGPEATALHGTVIEERYPQLETVSRCIDDHPDGIPTVEAEREALPYVESLAREMADSVDALAISCALDPAVGGLQAELSVPVIGAGRAVSLSAMALGNRVGTIGLEAGDPPIVRETLGEARHASGQVEGANTTNFLTSDDGRAAIEATATALVDDGCTVIAPVCTGITTSGVLPHLRRLLEVPVVDPVESMGAIATLVARGGD